MHHAPSDPCSPHRFFPSAEQAARAKWRPCWLPSTRPSCTCCDGSAGPDVKHVDPQARLGQLARQLARRHGIVVKALAHGGAGLVQRILHAAAGADLLVLGHSPLAAGVAAMARRHAVAGAARQPCPVLVVQRATRGAYRHVLVKMDAWPQSQAPGALTPGALDEAAAVELFMPPGRSKRPWRAGAWPARRAAPAHARARAPVRCVRCAAQPRRTCAWAWVWTTRRGNWRCSSTARGRIWWADSSAAAGWATGCRAACCGICSVTRTATRWSTRMTGPRPRRAGG